MNNFKVHEACKKCNTDHRYALTISAKIDSEHPIEAQIRHINEAFIRWVRSRGAQCDALVIAYTAEPGDQQRVLEVTEDLLSQDIAETWVVPKLSMALMFLDVSGRVYRQFSLGKAKEPQKRFRVMANDF